MKRKDDNNLDKNISRLVKLAGDSDKPSKAFSDSLIEDALKQLKEGGADSKREGKDKTMKFNRIKILSWAAVIVLVGGLAAALMMPSLSRVRRMQVELRDAGRVSAPRTEGTHSLVTKDYKAAERAKIEYTDKQVAALDAAKPAAAGEVDKQIAMSEVKSEPLYVLRDVDSFKAGERVLQKAPDSISIKLGLERAGGKAVCCPMPGEKPAGRYPMAHGGTTPPNGDDVDAMFFKNYGVNPFVDTEDDHLSTFATDVDTGSYTVCRGYLHDGHLPPEKAVRVEEFVNYFKYGYEAPQEDDFAVYTEGCPWSFGEGRKNSYLLRIGLKGKQISEENRKPAILTFVIDVSGSMSREDRLGLVKKSLRMLVENLKEKDRIGIAVYGSRGRKVMDYKGLDEKAEILSAIESLHAEGSTYAEEGIRIGYDMADSAYRQGADEILEVIKEKAEKGITLSAIGFGMGNYNDVLMERLGDKGNGHYAYVDTIAEAKKLFEDNLTGTLQVIARDVKVQVDFNPEVVRSYRLIGYENRDVPDEKFRDDKYDGGEIGAGHSVTALYELKLWPDKKGTVATTFVRYKDADTKAVTEFKSSIAVGDFEKSLGDCGSGFRLAATVSEFAEILRKSYWAKGEKLDTVLERAQQLSEEFKGDADVIELADLISKAKQLIKDGDTKTNEAE
jgi:Ca-activated chloride channel family protein